jgi:Ca2+-binding RTX toxin-like protein
MPTIQTKRDVILKTNIARLFPNSDFSFESIRNALIPGILALTPGNPKDQTNAGETDVIYGHESIIGDAGNNSLFGTESGDTIFGRGGNDEIFGSEGVNTMYGEDGDDLIYGGSNVDYMYGGNGDDTIYASDGNNKLFGDAGDDIIYSGTGNDLIDGGIGNDTIWLGGGQDRIVLASDNGFDTINNFQLGQTTLGLSGGLTFENLAIAQQGNDTLIENAATGTLLGTLVGVQANSINSSSFVIV